MAERYSGNGSSMLANMISESKDGRVDNENIIQFMKPGYVIGMIVPKLHYYVKQGEF